MRIFYFGCLDRAGHFFWDTSGARDARSVDKCPFEAAQIDDAFTVFAFDEGHAQLIWAKGWTIVAWKDFSVDSRPGANSAFLLEGTHNFDDAMALVSSAFPQVIARQRNSIKHRIRVS